MTSVVSVVEHRAEWASEFLFESQALGLVLGRGTAQAEFELHHIGSTAIFGPWGGIAAKPIIDMLLTLRHLAWLDENTAKLRAMGYEALGEFGIAGRRYFRKHNAEGVRSHHLHAFERSSTHAMRHLAFRDYMCAHPSCAQAYGELKLRLAAAHPHSIDAYMDGKHAFIQEHEAKALVWRNHTPTIGA